MSTFGKWTEADVAAYNARNYERPKRANLSAGGSGKVAEPEFDTRPVPLAACQAQEATPERVHIRIVSVRKRLLDPDNLFPKWQIDALRYCRIIRGDEPDKITLETTQRKAAKGQEEHTIIEVHAVNTMNPK